MTDILTLDFETYYAKDYSLSKLTTEEYIRDPRFEVIGVSVSHDSSQPVWFSGTRTETKKFLTGYAWDNAIAVAHNAVFDMAILSWIFDIQPKHIVDTLSMARAIHGTEVGGSLKALSEHYSLGVKGTEVIAALGKRRIDFTAEELAAYGGYCCNDTALTYDLFRSLLVEKEGFPVEELKLIDLTLRMFTEPVLNLDLPVLEIYHNKLVLHKESLLYELGIDREYLMSNPKFAAILKGCGVQPPMKISPTTGESTYAFAKTDEGFKKLLEHSNPNVQLLVNTRLGVKSTLEETRTERFIEIAKRGKLPVPLRYYAAHTGRWGGDGKINLQNLKRTSKLKYAICAPHGYMLVDSDLSQIEARVLAMLAGQTDLVQAFEDKKDVYKIMASNIYRLPESEVDSAQRFVGKMTVLGCGYGMGAIKFQSQLLNFDVVLDETECKRIIDVYRETYSKIPALWRCARDVLGAIAEDKGTTIGDDSCRLDVDGYDGIRLPNGLYLKYPNLRQNQGDDIEMLKAFSWGKDMVYDTKKGRTVLPTRIYGGKVVENICQALARIVIGEQMVRVSKKYRVAMTAHDAMTVVVPENDVYAKEYIELCMRIRPEWAPKLPLDCESGTGDNYGDCK